MEQTLIEFVEHHRGIKQRDPAWYGLMGKTVGGSELAAIMGVNPYSRFESVVRDKLAILDGENPFKGGAACWWGSLFEDVIGAYVMIDLGTTIYGDDICIQAIEGHRNSPDGYLVARIYRNDKGRLKIWTTDLDPSLVVEERVALLEFKCPAARKPTGRIPDYYKPQVQSGLAVSPVAQFGLFVDAVFRKCDLLALGPGPEYDTHYHDRDRGAWDLPIAWGIIAVYAPPEYPAAAVIRGEDAIDGEPVDLGCSSKSVFERSLGLIDSGVFRVRRHPPHFADGRGSDLTKINHVIRDLGEAAPEGFELLGLLPWKLFEASYVTATREPGFLERVTPLIREVHRTVEEARAAPSREAYLAGQERARRGPQSWESVAEEDVQALFAAGRKRT